MADRRLEEIRTSDDQESTINFELIEWLKTTGVNILLVILLCVIAFRGYLWWQERQQSKIDAAWADFVGTTSAAALESLADKTAGVGAIPELSLLMAAQEYQRDVLRDQTLELLPEPPSISDPNSEDSPEVTLPAIAPMTAQERDETLSKMEGLYKRVLDLTAPSPGKTNWKNLLRIQAIFGLAAVAEMREDWDGAAQWYTQAEHEAGREYAPLGDVARMWRENPIKERPVFLPQSEINGSLFKPAEATAPPVDGVEDSSDAADTGEGVEPDSDVDEADTTTDDPVEDEGDEGGG